MVSSAGSSPDVTPGEASNPAAGGPAGLGTATAVAGNALARATGVCDGDGVCADLAVSDSASSFGDAVGFVFFFFPGLGVAFFPVDFFFGVGVESSSSAAFFDFFLGVEDLCGVGEGVFFDFGFAFGRGVGDSSALDPDCSSTAAIRLPSAPVLTCPRTSVARSATSTIAVIPPVQTRATAADRIRRDDAFKRAARSAANFPARCASRARGAELHSTFRRGAGADRSDTST